MVVSSDERARRGWAARFGARLRRLRLVVPVAAGVFLAIAASGEMRTGPAAAGFALIAAAGVIDQRRAAADRAALRARRERGGEADDFVIDAVIAGLPDPAVALEPGGLVRAFNRLALEVAPALAPARPLSFALRNPAVLEAVRRAVDSDGPQRAEVFQRVPAERWWEATIAPVTLPDGPGRTGERLLLLTFHDLTPLRHVEQMRADFVANASHELRTPLASLSGFIDTLQGPARADTAAREKFLGIMKAQAARMARLIDDLLSLSRIELKVHVRPETPVDLVLVLRQVVEGLLPLATERGVAIRFVPPEGAAIVPGDRDELVRAFENLVENALKYGASGERVDIALARETGVQGEEAVVSVRDYGPGIAPEHLPRLTERFYRADVAESRAQGGTGLGLALVKHILQRHRGRLGIDSALGAGATFTVRLPIVTEIRASRESDVKSEA
ncbi:Phosphate regulon sensor protein PhoR (SphS) [Rhodovulum sp. PH10]|uniref:ATP-binding protein n=1 Tax=Rhodovulum sp. PH10 TaxID=1187851 RepID=UPI00027C1E76|nr:ATP-binding protein [Rhodovulum sp. PH10]EJW10965.1 Phosphate regulon sensor protein PhoR (SphS) [Rhodovulum sp. PH10]